MYFNKLRTWFDIMTCKFIKKYNQKLSQYYIDMVVL